MKRRVAAFVAFGTVFLALDAVWLTVMTEAVYRPALGGLLRPDPDLLAAAAFYALYFFGAVKFVVMPSAHWTNAASRGAWFGLVAYGTFDLTNQAMLRGWPWAVTAVDLAWGACATAFAAMVARAAVSAWASHVERVAEARR